MEIQVSTSLLLSVNYEDVRPTINYSEFYCSSYCSQLMGSVFQIRIIRRSSSINVSSFRSFGLFYSLSN